MTTNLLPHIAINETLDKYRLNKAGIADMMKGRESLQNFISEFFKNPTNKTKVLESNDHYDYAFSHSLMWCKSLRRSNPNTVIKIESDGLKFSVSIDGETLTFERSIELLPKQNGL